MSNKDKYKAFCEAGLQPHLFLNYWWLNAVCGEQNWDVAITEKGDQIFGALPYVKRQKMGLSLIGSPKFTQHLGPYIIYPEGQQYFKRLSHEKEIIQDLVNQLPPHHYALIKCHYSLLNGLPFHWLGFEQSLKYTYVIDELKHEEELLAGLSSGTRKNLKKAKKHVEIIESEDVEQLFHLNTLTFNRQEKQTPFSLHELKQLYQACKDQKCGKILVAKDSKNQVHAGIFMVWNQNSAYYLLGGSDPKFRNSEALTLLLWEAILFSKSESKNFDFEGSMIEGIERFVRGFGAIQKPYLELKKYRNKALKAFFSFVN